MAWMRELSPSAVAPFGVRARRPVSGQLCETAGGGASMVSRFPVAFRLPAFACRVIHFPPRIWAFLAVGLPVTSNATGPRRGSHVPHVRYSTGVGASCIPGTVVLTRSIKNPRPAPATLLRPAPAPRSNNPSCEAHDNETSTEVHAIHPSGLPLARNPRMERESFGFPSSFTPRRYQRRMSRAGPGH
jgi:hypothetical protein